MILNYDRLSWQPMEHWPIAYRFTEQRYNKLPLEALATIRPLAEDSASQLAVLNDLGELARQAENNSLSSDWESEEIREDDWDALRCWLRQRRPSADDDVYIEWVVAGHCAAVVAWRTLCDYFDDFWYPFEVALISDDTRAWQLLVGPNDVARWLSPVPSLLQSSSTSTHISDKCKNGIDYQKYKTMKHHLLYSAREISHALLEDGASSLESIKILRQLFSISAPEALEELNRATAERKTPGRRG